MYLLNKLYKPCGGGGFLFFLIKTYFYPVFTVRINNEKYDKSQIQKCFFLIKHTDIIAVIIQSKVTFINKVN